MICYLVRHGKDDETVRGGWSQYPLTNEGVQQAIKLGENICCNQSEFLIKRIYSSDLLRAAQTARIVGNKLALPVEFLEGFREANNGDLAGMSNTLALQRYPGLFWNQLAWEQSYPGGESPRQFYERIAAAWDRFSGRMIEQNENALLITHGGVIHVILSIIHQEMYSNAACHREIGYTEMIALEFNENRWLER